MAQPLLFEPISLRDVTLKNRVVGGADAPVFGDKRLRHRLAT